MPALETRFKFIVIVSPFHSHFESRQGANEPYPQVSAKFEQFLI
jgi:hypothetical protein